MPISYDPTNNIVTCVGDATKGDSESNPFTFEDLYNADKAGMLQLLSPTTAAMDLDLDRQIRPADSGALRLSLIITNYSPPKGTVTLSGKDMFDQTQQEEMEITGNGEYLTNEYWKSIDSGGIDCIGTYTIEITQPRWGVISKFGKQYSFDCRLIFGDGVASTYFTEKSKQTIFLATAISGLGQKFIEIKGEATFTLGILDDLSAKRTSQGVSVMVTADYSGTYLLYSSGTAIVYLYSTQFATESEYAHIRLIGSSSRIWNCVFEKVTLYQMTNADIFNINSWKYTSTGYAPIYRLTGCTMDKINVFSSYRAFYVAAGSFTVSNVYVRGTTDYLATLIASGTDPAYFINVDSDTWNLFWAFSGTRKVFRQYEFNAHCQDKDGNDLSGVSVVAEYINPYGQAFSETTDGNGDIPTQTVDHGFFDPAHESTEQMKTPLKVTYSKTGYQTVVKYYDMDEKTKDRVVLHKAVGVFLDFGRPVVNLKKNDPENKNVMVL